MNGEVECKCSGGRAKRSQQGQRSGRGAALAGVLWCSRDAAVQCLDKPGGTLAAGLFRCLMQFERDYTHRGGPLQRSCSPGEYRCHMSIPAPQSSRPRSATRTASIGQGPAQLSPSLRRHRCRRCHWHTQCSIHAAAAVCWELPGGYRCCWQIGTLLRPKVLICCCQSERKAVGVHGCHIPPVPPPRSADAPRFQRATRSGSFRKLGRAMLLECL